MVELLRFLLISYFQWVRIPFDLSARLSSSLNIPASTGPLSDSLGLVNGVSTSPAQPNIRSTRVGTLLAPRKPLAPPPTVLQSLKAILLASCSCYFFVTRGTPIWNAPLGLNILLLCIPVSVRIQPDRYVRALIYSSNSGLCISLCLHPILRILWFSSVSSHVFTLTTHLNLSIAFISFIPFYYTLSQSVSKMHLSVAVFLIWPRLAIIVCHGRIITASWADTGWPLECHSRKIYSQ